MTHEQNKALDKLIAAVESGGDAIQHNICIYAAHAFPPESAYGKCTFHEVDRAFRGSIDAAKALHDALLPGWFPGMSQNIYYVHWYAYVQNKATLKHFSAKDNNPARAWLIAILKAYRAQMDTITSTSEK